MTRGSEPRQYLCRRTAGLMVVDGRLSEPTWKRAEWTELFVDIEGDRRPAPTYGTRAMMALGGGGPAEDGRVYVDPIQGAFWAEAGLGRQLDLREKLRYVDSGAQYHPGLSPVFESRWQPKQRCSGFSDNTGERDGIQNQTAGHGI